MENLRRSRISVVGAYRKCGCICSKNGGTVHSVLFSANQASFAPLLSDNWMYMCLNPPLPFIVKHVYIIDLYRTRYLKRQPTTWVVRFLLPSNLPRQAYLGYEASAALRISYVSAPNFLHKTRRLDHHWAKHHILRHSTTHFLNMYTFSISATIAVLQISGWSLFILFFSWTAFCLFYHHHNHMLTYWKG